MGNEGKCLFTFGSLISINKHLRFVLSLSHNLMINCEHCDVDAYYRLTIEDFNNTEAYSSDLCIKCIKIEASKAIGDLPAIKSLKIEPLFSMLTTSSPIV